MACHILHPVFKGLQLGYPTKVQGSSTVLYSDSAPNAEMVKYTFPARDNMPKVAMPEVEVYWYDGGLQPPRPAGVPAGRNLNDDGVKPGDTIDSSIVQAAIALNQLLPERIAFDWAPGLGIGYLNEFKYWVHFGDYTRLNAKVAAYRAFIEQIQIKPDQEITLLDLSVPEHPYYKVAP